MTLDEKVAQLGSVWSFEIVDGERSIAARAARQHLAQGIGQVTRPGGATNLEPPGGRASRRTRSSATSSSETRLGIPAILHEESLHGLMARGATCFPQAIGQAATLGPAARRAHGAAPSGRGLRAVGASQALSPVFDVARDPRWGRIEETFGEDPYLIAALGCGLRARSPGDARRRATGHRQPSSTWSATGCRRAASTRRPSHIGTRELLDDFLFPFEAAVRVAGTRLGDARLRRRRRRPLRRLARAADDHPARAVGLRRHRRQPTTRASTSWSAAHRAGRGPVRRGTHGAGGRPGHGAAAHRRLRRTTARGHRRRPRDAGARGPRGRRASCAPSSASGCSSGPTWTSGSRERAR